MMVTTYGDDLTQAMGDSIAMIPAMIVGMNADNNDNGIWSLCSFVFDSNFVLATFI